METGALNDTHVVITKGVAESDALMLMPPADHATIAGTRLPGSTAGEKLKGGDAPPTQSVPLTPPPKSTKSSGTSAPPAAKPAAAKPPAPGRSGGQP